VRTKKASSRVDKQVAKNKGRASRAKPKGGRHSLDNNHHRRAKIARAARDGKKRGKVQLVPGGKAIAQGVAEVETPLYLISSDISTNLSGGVEVTAGADGNLTFTGGGTVLYTLPVDGLQGLEASASLNPDGLSAGLTADLPSVPGIDSSVSVDSDGDVTLSIDGNGVRSEITFKPEGEIEVATTVHREIQGTTVELSVTTTIAPAPPRPHGVVGGRPDYRTVPAKKPVIVPIMTPAGMKTLQQTPGAHKHRQPAGPSTPVIPVYDPTAPELTTGEAVDSLLELLGFAVLGDVG
jgi:hypothetical protein